jgi:hypothetical protein
MIGIRPVAVFLRLGIAASSSVQIDKAIVGPVGYHPSDLSYFNTHNLYSLALGGEWYEFSRFDSGTKVDYSDPANADVRLQSGTFVPADSSEQKPAASSSI